MAARHLHACRFIRTPTIIALCVLTILRLDRMWIGPIPSGSASLQIVGKCRSTTKRRYHNDYSVGVETYIGAGRRNGNIETFPANALKSNGLVKTQPPGLIGFSASHM